jgi:hypothetical protein
MERESRLPLCRKYYLRGEPFPLTRLNRKDKIMSECYINGIKFDNTARYTEVAILYSNGSTINIKNYQENIVKIAHLSDGYDILLRIKNAIDNFSIKGKYFDSIVYNLSGIAQTTFIIDTGLLYCIAIGVQVMDVDHFQEDIPLYIQRVEEFLKLISVEIDKALIPYYSEQELKRHKYLKHKKRSDIISIILFILIIIITILAVVSGVDPAVDYYEFGNSTAMVYSCNDISVV